MSIDLNITYNVFNTNKYFIKYLSNNWNVQMTIVHYFAFYLNFLQF